MTLDRFIPGFAWKFAGRLAAALAIFMVGAALIAAPRPVAAEQDQTREIQDLRQQMMDLHQQMLGMMQMMMAGNGMPMMRPAWGPGMMMGQGYGPGMASGCGMMGCGYGATMMYGPGYGMGAGMMNGPATGMGPGMMGGGMMGNDAQGSRALWQAEMSMHQSMNQPYSGDVDRDFVAHMIAHHEGAVAMAQAVLQYGKDPQIKQLAQDIVSAQQKEIEMMKDWLAKHPMEH